MTESAIIHILLKSQDVYAHLACSKPNEFLMRSGCWCIFSDSEMGKLCRGKICYCNRLPVKRLNTGCRYWWNFIDLTLRLQQMSSFCSVSPLLPIVICQCPKSPLTPRLRSGTHLDLIRAWPASRLYFYLCYITCWCVSNKHWRRHKFDLNMISVTPTSILRVTISIIYVLDLMPLNRVNVLWWTVMMRQFRQPWNKNKITQCKCIL